MIIYIHGFGSSGFAHKASIIKEFFGKENVFTPSLSYIPQLAIDTLEQSIEILAKDYQQITLIGSSLGGYYAIYLANKYDLKAVLINPSIYPYKTLAENLGLKHSYFDLSHYEWIQSHINSLKQYEVEEIKPDNFLVLLQKGDDVLNYKEAKNKFQKSSLEIEEGGSHGYDNFESKMEMIKTFTICNTK